MPGLYPVKAFLFPLTAVMLLASLVATPAVAATLDEQNETARWLLEARAMIRSRRHFEAIEKLQATVALADQTGQHLVAALALANMAEIYRIFGDTEKTIGFYRGVLERYRALGHRTGIETAQKKLDELGAPTRQPEQPETRDEASSQSVIDRAVERVRQRLRTEHDARDDTRRPGYAAYLDSVKKAIVDAWTYPEVAMRNFKEGSVEVEFTIREDGLLDGVRVVQTSGHASMDQAALAAVQAATPFPRIPEHLGIKRLSVEFTFNYALK